jgi:hypothetical protein
MEAWARERRTNREVDLRGEMLTLLRRLELDVRVLLTSASLLPLHPACIGWLMVGKQS